MKQWEKGKRAVLTACGFRIPRKEIGQATAVLKECRRCWPEPDFAAHEAQEENAETR